MKIKISYLLLSLIVFGCGTTADNECVESIYGIYEGSQRCGIITTNYTFELSTTNTYREVRISFVGAGSFSPFEGIVNSDCSTINVQDQFTRKNGSSQTLMGSLNIIDDRVAGTIVYSNCGSCVYNMFKQ